MIYGSHGKIISGKYAGRDFQFSFGGGEIFEYLDNAQYPDTVFVRVQPLSEDRQSLEKGFYLDTTCIDWESVGNNRPEIKAYFDSKPVQVSPTRIVYHSPSTGEMIHIYDPMTFLSIFNLKNIVKGVNAPSGDTMLIGLFQTVEDSWKEYERKFKKYLGETPENLIRAVSSLCRTGNMLELMQSDLNITMVKLTEWRTGHEGEGKDEGKGEASKVEDSIRAITAAKGDISKLGNNINRAYADILTAPESLRPLISVLKDTPLVQKLGLDKEEGQDVE